MTEFELKMNEWANNAVSYCHATASDTDQDMDLAFYAFQSAPKYSPSILVLGLNPGGYPFTYSDKYNNDIWGLENKMTSDVFIKANPCKESYTEFKLWRNLYNMFVNSGMEEVLRDHVYMNYIYFNTSKFSDLYKRQGGASAISNCKAFSLELIRNVLHPKSILCLGTSDCFDRMPVTNKEVLLQNKKRLLLKGDLNGIPTYGIPHPSGSYTSYNDLSNIGSILRQELIPIETCAFQY